MRQKPGNLDLEGRLVILAGDSKDSRKTADDIATDFNEDHEMGRRIVRLNVTGFSYKNGKNNFEIRDPERALNMNDIEYLIRHSDTYFVSKLENPFMADPLRYSLDSIVKDFSREYFHLSNKEKNKPKFKKYFASYVEGNLSEQLKGLVDRSLINYNLRDVGNAIFKIFESNKNAIDEVFLEANGSNNINPRHEILELLRFSLQGYIGRIVNKRDASFFLDEQRAISDRVGNEILRKGDKGRFNWVIPFLDGRSDHNKKNPYECVRVNETARLAKDSNVSSVFTIQAHSQKQIESFVKKRITVENLTQTNELISMLAQDMSADFKQMYVLSPDEGGAEDAMVFAREIHRRTNGEFGGRVVVFKKTRSTHGIVEKMEFLGSWLYQPDKERKKDMGVKDEEGHDKPYDLLHMRNYKVASSKNYIGRLFKQEHGESQLNVLQEEINGHRALTRDDIIATAGTGLSASSLAYKLFKSVTDMFAEHPSFVGDSIQKITEQYEKGRVGTVYTSTSINHPNAGERPWHEPRSMSFRIKKYMKKHFMAWLEHNYTSTHTRLMEYSTTATK